MSNLWYGSDEVRVFHPIVENCINEAIKRLGFLDKYIVKHHHGAFTSGIPDFAILDKRTEDFVCIIEVKKTPTDVFGQEAGYQTKTYVHQLYPIKWKLNYHPHFCVTNIEYTQCYSLRENTSLIGCLLESNPKYADDINSDDLSEKFVNILMEYISYLDSLETPRFSMHLETISESFNKSFYNVSQILGANLSRISNFVSKEEDLKQNVLYELFRFAFYYYIKEYYLLKKSDLAKYFNKFETDKLTSSELVNLINKNFNKVMEIDFIDILSNYKSPDTIFPNRILASHELGEIFNNFILTLEKNAHDGLEKNVSLLNYVSLITSDIYNKKEMHDTGKIMSDEILSDILSGLSINNDNDKVIDPCCGDGNLLVSCYKRKKELLKQKSEIIDHNKLLSTLNGIDIDPNLIQLSAFKLIGQNLDKVNDKTRTRLIISDLFNLNINEKYDTIVMNPPYLRNEDLLLAEKERWISNIEKNTGRRSFIRDVAQPNLYYFFVEKATEMINKEGNAAYILMSKFLNNKDGLLLKKYLIPYLDTVLHYPPSFFEGFSVTTDIFILKNKEYSPEKISFLNVKNTEILRDIEKLKNLINNKADKFENDYSIINIKKNDIDASSNWRLYFIDPLNKFEKFNSILTLVTLKSLFSEIKRGKAGNSGASSNLFINSGNNEIKNEANKIEPEYIGFGLLRNNISEGRRKFILTEKCLESSEGLHLPDLQNNDFSNIKPGIREYINAIKRIVDPSKFNHILSEASSSKIIPEIIIPRGDRTKHTVFYYPFTSKKVLLSTNFFSLSGLRNINDPGCEDKIKFVTAFLISSLGQIQFEIHGNSQEGSRKIEKFIIEKFKIIDPNRINKSELDSVIKEFELLNKSDDDFLGNEAFSKRDKLDYEICKILFEKDNLDFSSVDEMKKYFQNFLLELVNNRILL